jgi:5-methylcytosine-specific restriction protein B
MSFFQELNNFLELAKIQKPGLATVNVEKYNKERLKTYNGLTVDVSFGKGRATFIPWITFLANGQTTTNGIYPVFLYYKEHNTLILSYGISETTPPQIKWVIKNATSIYEYFKENNLVTPRHYGESYVYKVYSLNTPLNASKIDIDLGNLIQIYKSTLENYSQISFSNTPKYFVPLDLIDLLKVSGFQITKNSFLAFLASILTKQFVIITGLSGSGKTRIAQAFSTWISGSKEQYSIVPVGADWTNREPLLGYPNSFDNSHYVLPDSGVLKILLSAFNNYMDNEGDVSKCRPYFLILDEMNLSHVERYFADFLSAMESGDYIKLYADGNRSWKTDIDGNYDPQFHVEHQIKLPPNLFIIGTVNIDETTYMFSPKVLDRANTIEFRISPSELESFILNQQQLDMNKLIDDPVLGKGKGSPLANDFMKLLSGHGLNFEKSKHKEMFTACFTALQMAGAEFGYRVVNEITRLISYLEYFGVENNEAYDVAIMQKLLPKLNGSRSKLSKVLPKLGMLCLKSNKEQDAIDIFNQFKESRDIMFDGNKDIKYPISLEKLCRMYKNAQENGFASFAEA